MKAGTIVRVTTGRHGFDDKPLTFLGVVESIAERRKVGKPTSNRPPGCAGWILVRAVGTYEPPAWWAPAAVALVEEKP